jgi:hypothetical protein
MCGLTVVLPYAQWHYPFENKDKNANKDFPEISLLKVWIRLVDGSLHAIATLVLIKPI